MLADYFDCTVDYILYRSEYANNSSPLSEPSEGDADFSERLKSLRKEKNITQEQLASIIGVERSSVGKYESSNVFPSVDVLCRMSHYFGVDVDFLVGKAGRKHQSVITDKDLQIALFGSDSEDTQAMWDQVKTFASFLKSQNRQ